MEQHMERWLNQLFSPWPEASSHFRVHLIGSDDTAQGLSRAGLVLELMPVKEPSIYFRFPCPTKKGAYLFKGRERILALQLNFPLRCKETDLLQGRLVIPMLREFHRFLKWLRDHEDRLHEDHDLSRLLLWEATVNTPQTEMSLPLLDDTNPLAELAHKRKISIPGRYEERRFIHASQYGRLCPLETPESKEIGKRLFLARGAQVHGEHILAGYRSRSDTVEVRLQAEEERGLCTAPTLERRQNGQVLARTAFQNEAMWASEDAVDYLDADPSQFLSYSSSLVPFIQHTDGARAMMGGKNLKQALPLLQPECPLIRTGFEREVAYQSGRVPIARLDGTVIAVDSAQIVLGYDEGHAEEVYPLASLRPGNKGCHFHRPCVRVGQHVSQGTPLADAAAIHNGELALGLNTLVAYMPYYGYNFEDGIVISDSVAQRFTSRHVYRFNVEADLDESFTADGSSIEQHRLTAEGLIQSDVEVRQGDVLIRRRLADGTTIDRCWDHSYSGRVVRSELVHEGLAEVWVAADRPLAVGDKLTGRHGNKGVVARILADKDMPWFQWNGRRYAVEALLNPLGVISRMNLGQLWETHASWLVSTGRWSADVGSPFQQTDLEMLQQDLAEIGVAEGKHELFLGDQSVGRVVVGYQYLAKLDHLAEDKLHVRAPAPQLSRRVMKQPQGYSRVTGQPLQGKRLGGGQRLGEMEVWALLAHDARGLLQECLTAKSDDEVGRRCVADVRSAKADAQLLETAVCAPHFPETLRTLQYYLRGVGLDLTFHPPGEINQIEYLSLRFATSEDILGWSNGQVKSAKDLYNPEIFGYSPQEQRAHMGHIQLPEPFLHPMLARSSMLEAQLGKERCREINRPLRQWLSRLNSQVEVKEQRNGTNADTETSQSDQGSTSARKLSPAHLWTKPYGWWVVQTDDGEQLLWTDEAAVEVTKNHYHVSIDHGRTRKSRRFRSLPQALQWLHTMMYRREPEREARPLACWLYDQLLPEERATCFLKAVPVLPPAYRAELEHGLHHLTQLYIRLREELSWKIKSDRKWQHSSNNRRRVIFEALQALFLEGPAEGRKTRALMEHLEGKWGLLRHALLGKRQDYSGRAVIVPDPQLMLDECALPLDIALPLLAPLVHEKLSSVYGSERAYGLIEEALLGETKTRLELQRTLEEVISQNKILVLLNRQPTLHKFNILAFRPHIRLDSCIGIPPLVCSGFNADFDGDTMAVHLPLSALAQTEARGLLPSQNLFKSANGELVLHLALDIVLGSYLLGATEHGRQYLTETLGSPVANEVTGSRLRKMVADRIRDTDEADAPLWLQELQTRAFQAATESAGKISFNLFDLQALGLTNAQKGELAQRIQAMSGELAETLDDRLEVVADAVMAHINSQPDNPLSAVVRSGARSNKTQLRQVLGMLGWVQKENGEPADLFIPSSFLDGLEPLEYWTLTHATRRVMIDKKLGVAQAGELTRQLVEGTYELAISEEDCGTEQGITLDTSWFKSCADLLDSLIGRYALAPERVFLDKILSTYYKSVNWTHITVRSPLTCASQTGVCQRCYGWDLARRALPRLGTPVGLIAAQSIGERGTQLSMRTFHTGGKALDIGTVRRILVGGKIPGLESGRAELQLSELAQNGIQTVVDEVLPLMRKTYGQDVAPIHFETTLAVMAHNGWRSLSSLAGDWRRRGFLAAASYQRARQVLGQAASAEATDSLQSLKSHVMLGMCMHKEG